MHPIRPWECCSWGVSGALETGRGECFWIQLVEFSFENSMTLLPFSLLGKLYFSFSKSKKFAERSGSVDQSSRLREDLHVHCDDAPSSNSCLKLSLLFTTLYFCEQQQAGNVSSHVRKIACHFDQCAELNLILSFPC
mmetsp:Transcript_8064/g.29946  ORF Transcript_8064/g.29946 Transcript_8064/m.29946 type:complete len:137 (+) Transcript_8064:1822-2232(+)